MKAIKMKSLIVVLFIASAAAAAEQLLCTPNSLFRQDCNSCICSQDGRSAACTDMACPAEGQRQTYCEPGKQFQLDDLSSCICSSDGKSAACTLGLQAYGRSRHLAKNSQYCSPGSTFSPDKCNSCVCSEDGSKAVCTLHMCPVQQRQPEQVCEPGKSFKDYCNTCFCDADGSSYACTRMYCDQSIWNKDGSLKVAVAKSAEGRVCEPRRTFMDYCNSCVCSDDGLSAACTRMWCDKSIWNADGTIKAQAGDEAKRVCEPRKSFKRYCNSCACSDDGLSFACTRMHCDKSLWNADGSIRSTRKSAEAPVCAPNTHFKEQCNVCTCSADGLSKFCTMMACDALDGQPKERVCSPRSTFSLDGCNSCKCDDSGTDYVCTFKLCR